MTSRCWACGGFVTDFRYKLHCTECGRINEGCCEGIKWPTMNERPKIAENDKQTILAGCPQPQPTSGPFPT